MTRILFAVALSGLLVGQAPAPSPAPVQLVPAPLPSRVPVQLVPESLAEFASAYRAEFGRDPDAAHLDGTKYHAYRYRNPGNVMIGMARWVLVDSAGSMNVSGEPGTVTRGGIDKTFARDSHITLPIGVDPIVVDHPCFRQRQDIPNSHVMSPTGDCPTMPPYPQASPVSMVLPASLVNATPASPPKLVQPPTPPLITINTVHAKFSSGWTERRLVRDARGICWSISSRPPRSDGHATSVATRRPCPRATVELIR